jgi:hypothetical protein
VDIGMNGPLDDVMVEWTGRGVSKWKRNMLKLADTVHKIMLDGQSEE